MKSFLKCLATGIAVVLVICIVITTVLLRSSQEVKANESFDGINNIIEGNSEGNPYTIYELVPDSNMGEIGYMIDGQEPIDWKSELKNIASSESRKNYINTELHNLFSSICSEDTTRPLTYKTYEESYLFQENWDSFTLANPDIIPAGTTGYGMIENIGAGDYTLSFTYNVNTNATGMYDQNVLYYQYVNNGGYYGLNFIPTQPVVDAETGELVAKDADGNDIILYKVSETSPIITQEIYDSVLTNTPNAYLYRLNRDNLNGAFELVGKISSGTVSFEDIEKNDNYIYYTVHFEYVGENPQLSEDTVYYTAEINEFFNEKSGEYGGILNPQEPYILATSQDEAGNPVNYGHFDLDPSKTHYEYVGDGNGQYDLRIGVETDSLIEPLYLSTVYYKGGFTNNNWFKYGVFDQDGLLSESSREMYFNVKTLVPEQFNSYDINSCDLLYISANAFNRSSNTDLRAFGNDNDISWNQLCNIMTLVQSSNHFPVVVDYSILGNSLNDLVHATNLQKLVALLCSQNTDGVSFTPDMTADSIDWSAIAQGIIQDADHHFVNKNIYVYPGNTDPKSPYMLIDTTSGTPQYFTTPFIKKSDTFNDVTEFETEAEGIGFGEIADKIDTQNFNRRTENEALNEQKYDYFDLEISRAIVMEYILSYTDETAAPENKSKISVLDIEPCYISNDNVSDALTKAKVKKWFPDLNDNNITIRHMSTAEFIGNIDDISQYDLIYVGMSVDRLNTENGRTVYNDKRMNGMVYVNVGDIAVITENCTGMLDSDYIYNAWNMRTGVYQLGNENKCDGSETYYNSHNSYRYSGNDITREKMEDLREYVYAGYPVVVADHFYVDSANKKTVDESYVDNCSNMYEMFNGVLGENGEYTTKPIGYYSNVMTESQANKNRKNLEKYANLGKPSITVYGDIGKSDNDIYNLNTNSILIDFSISNKGAADTSALFDVVLYLDTNADGKFSYTTEAVDANTIKVYNGDSLIRPVEITDSEGKSQYKYQLAAGENNKYRVEYTLSEEYVGIIPWRLKVRQTTNDYRYDFKGGYVHYKKPNTDKVTIDVLQIGTQFDEHDDPVWANEHFNMEKAYNEVGSKFREYVDNIEDYKLNIKYKSSSEFGEEYKGWTVERLEEYYDMIIIGFADCYRIVDQNGCVDLLKQYINRGNPVLFTHDTTSFTNSDLLANETDVLKGWGYDFNKKIRDSVGLDRYGILNSTALKKGVQLTQNTTDYNAAVKYADKNDTDIAYVPGSNKTKIAKQNQGYTYGNLSYYSKDIKDKNYNNYFYLKDFQDVAHDRGTLDKWRRSDSIDKTNSGQITMYPYKLPNSFSIADTHFQYYQLNLNEDNDKDGESDIVVWYTLNNDSLYGKSRYDIRNNYYIYTKGNVTYSGVGHSQVKNEDSYELKLYINTIVAAYKQGLHAPSIEIKNSDADDAETVTTIYESFDQRIDENGVVTADADSVEQQVSKEKEKADALEKIYFTVDDTNIVRNLKRKEIRVDFCIPVDQTEYDTLPEEYKTKVTDSNDNWIYLKKLDLNCYRKNAEGNYQQMTTYYTSGITYRADIPLSLLPSNSNYVEIYAVTYTEIVRNTNDGTDTISNATSNSYATVRIQRVGLTDLD